MKHHKTNRIFGRSASQRTALMRGLAISLIQHERITTTEAKAKELRPFIEKMVTRAKKGDVFARRIVSKRLGGNQEPVVKKLVDEVAKRYDQQPGGYTRIVKLPPRKGDASPMAVIEFV